VKRIRNWDLALHRWATAQAGRAFDWGQTDCATLTLRALSVMYVKPLLVLDPVWESSAGALRIIGERPGIIVNILRGQLKAQPILPAFTSIGDILLLPGAPLPHLYVHLGRYVLATDPVRGVHLGPAAELLATQGLSCWRIPNG
jgi:hypothetical protein